MRFIPAAGGASNHAEPPGVAAAGKVRERTRLLVGRHGGARQIAVEGRLAPASQPIARDGAAAALWAVARAARAAG